MHLVVTATQFEMDAFKALDRSLFERVAHLVCGVGPVESAVRVTHYLAAHHRKIDSVVNFGIGGAYCTDGPDSVGLLDICVAEEEVLGDFGICYGTETTAFTGDVFPANRFAVDGGLVQAATSVLAEHTIDHHRGVFVTVNGASGRKSRGDSLSGTYGAICENMEGAAIARACLTWAIPFFEVRAISNMVEDRPGSEWKTAQACERAARAAALIVKRLRETP